MEGLLPFYKMNFHFTKETEVQKLGQGAQPLSSTAGFHLGVTKTQFFPLHHTNNIQLLWACCQIESVLDSIMWLEFSLHYNI